MEDVLLPAMIEAEAYECAAAVRDVASMLRSIGAR